MMDSQVWTRILGGIVAAVALLAPSQLAGQAEGIKVHGDWVIEVRNADGTLAQRREFKNALENGGKQDLVDLLGRGLAVQSWRVIAQATANGMCLTIAPYCQMAEEGDNSSSGATSVSHNLTVTRQNVELVLNGSFTAVNGGQIGSVSTLIMRDNTALRGFSSTTLPTPIPVEASQSVSVTVTFSFQ